MKITIELSEEMIKEVCNNTLKVFKGIEDEKDREDFILKIKTILLDLEEDSEHIETSSRILVTKIANDTIKLG